MYLALHSSDCCSAMYWIFCQLNPMAFKVQQIVEALSKCIEQLALNFGEINNWIFQNQSEQNSLLI